MKKNYPTFLSDIVEIFEYRDGNLYWKKAISKKTKIGKIAGSKCNDYKRVAFHGQEHYVHRIIFAMHNGFMPKFVDHIDNNKSNNRIENLRQATWSENQWNHKIRANNKSGVKGVSWVSRDKLWKAQCFVNGINNQLGHYKDLEEAKKVVIEFRQQNHGNFANNG
jgi:hypothetical protein